MSWKSDKVARTKHYYQYVFKQKEQNCTACNGSGWYDWSDPETGYHPKCGACEGTGKETYRDIKDQQIMSMVMNVVVHKDYQIITNLAKGIEDINMRMKIAFNAERKAERKGYN